MAEKKVIEIELNAKGFDEAEKKTVSLKSQLKQLKDRLGTLDEGSDEFKKLVRDAGELQDKIGDLNNTVKNFASDTSNLDGAIGGIQAVTGAFGIAEGASALFGEENEELQKSLMKVQGAMALVTSVQAVANAVQKDGALMTSLSKLSLDKLALSFKGLKGAILATGIGALVVALGFLVANWDKVSSAISRVSAKQKAFNEITATAIDNVAKELSASDKLRKTLNDESITREDKVKAVKKLQEQYPDLLSNIDAEKNSLQEINKALKLNTQLTLLKAQQDAIAELRATSLKDAIKDQVDAQTGANVGAYEYILALGDESKAKLIATGDSQRLQNSKRKEIKVYDELDKSIEKQISALESQGAVSKQVDKVEEKSNDNANNRAEEAKRRAEEAQRIEAERLRNIIELENEYKAQIEAIAEDNFQNSLTQQQREVQAVEDKYFTLLEKAKDNAEDLAILEQGKEFELKAIRDKSQAERDALDKDLNEKRIAKEDEIFKLKQELTLTDKELELQNLVDSYEAKYLLAVDNAELEKLLDEQLATDKKAINDKYRATELASEKELNKAKVDIASQGLTLISDLSNLFAKQDEASAKRNFNIQKAVSLAQAGISAVQGVQSAFTTASASPITLLNPAYPFIQAGLAGAFGAVNIAKIAKSKYQGSVSNPSSSGGGGSGSSGGGGNSVTAPNFNVVGNNGQNQLGQLNQQPIQAFVVSGEVTSAQSLDRNRIQNATL